MAKAFVQVSAAPPRVRELAETLRAMIPGVVSCDVTTGGLFDLMVVIEMDDIYHLMELARRIKKTEGVIEISTSTVVGDV